MTGFVPRERLSAPVAEMGQMASAAKKITLSASRDIPFNKLVLSQANVRRIKAGVSIEELAEDIARRTLLQSITVRPVLDDGGAETGMFEIPAGGRRYRALELLVKQKRLAAMPPSPASCAPRELRRRTASPKTSSARPCIRSISFGRFRRCARRARARRKSPQPSSSASPSSSSACGSLPSRRDFSTSMPRTA